MTPAKTKSKQKRMVREFRDRCLKLADKLIALLHRKVCGKLFNEFKVTRLPPIKPYLPSGTNRKVKVVGKKNFIFGRTIREVRENNKSNE